MFAPFLKDTQVVLASSSPRRKNFLSEAGIDYICVSPSVEEKARPGERATDYVKRNAELKMMDVVQRHNCTGPTFFISADTVVVLNDEILEKPTSPDDAKTMLRKLSANWHEVITGLSVAYKTSGSELLNRKTISVHSKVLFKSLRDDEIEWYVSTKEPLDKAGSYAIQGKGCYLIERVNGSYSNIVGLPMAELYNLLANLG